MVTFGPLSVLPEFQGKGVGSRLVKHSTNVAKEMGIPAIVVYGNPHYYGRCGFRLVARGDKYDITNMKGEFCCALQVLQLQEDALDGVSGGFQESSLFSEINPAELEAFDSSFPLKTKEVTETQRAHKIIVSLKYKSTV